MKDLINQEDFEDVDFSVMESNLRSLDMFCQYGERAWSNYATLQPGSRPVYWYAWWASSWQVEKAFFRFFRACPIINITPHCMSTKTSILGSSNRYFCLSSKTAFYETQHKKLNVWFTVIHPSGWVRLLRRRYGTVSLRSASFFRLRFLLRQLMCGLWNGNLLGITRRTSRRWKWQTNGILSVYLFE